MPFVIFDLGDGTYYSVDHEMGWSRRSAFRFGTRERAKEKLEECDMDRLLRHRLRIMRVGPYWRPQDPERDRG